MELPLIGYGTYRLKNPYTNILYALRLGYRSIDTASLYQNEVEVGKAIKDSGIPREEIFLTTKVKLADLLKGEEGIRSVVKLSLERLNTYIDLLLLHVPTNNLRENWQTLISLQSSQVRRIGVSNFDIKHLEQLSGEVPYANQIELSPFLPRKELVSYCQKLGIKIIAHSSLTKGRKLNDQRLIVLSQNKGTTPAQLLLSWAVSQGFAVIPMSSNKDHIKENLIIPLDLQMETFDEEYATHPKLLK